MRARLELDGQPFDYRDYSPTPLDGYLLKQRGGILYDEAALEYMDRLRLRQMGEFTSIQQINNWVALHADAEPIPTIGSVMREINVQHSLKLRRNDAAVQSLRANHTNITPEHAEEIMQVRAGIASIPTAMRFLAHYPEVGGIEVWKATRPFDPMATWLARAAFLAEINTLDEPDIALSRVDELPRYLVITPDKELQDVPDKRIVVLKTRLAETAVKLDELSCEQEIIWRDSGVILDPRINDVSKAYMVGRDDDAHEVFISPASVSAYIRVA